MMTREDIIRMAREAGWDAHHAEFDTRIQHFAAIVAAVKQQEMFERIRHIIVQAEERGAAAEREACAKVCETFYNHEAKDCAAAIRARSKS